MRLLCPFSSNSTTTTLFISTYLTQLCRFATNTAPPTLSHFIYLCHATSAHLRLPLARHHYPCVNLYPANNLSSSNNNFLRLCSYLFVSALSTKHVKTNSFRMETTWFRPLYACFPDFSDGKYLLLQCKLHVSYLSMPKELVKYFYGITAIYMDLIFFQTTIFLL